MVGKRPLIVPLMAAILLLVVLIPANAAFAELPDSCVPEDREIPGNTNSPCKYDFGADRITTVEYSVIENTEGNSCSEVLTFSPYNGIAEWEQITSARIQLGIVDAGGNPRERRPSAVMSRDKQKSVVATANTIQVRIGHSYTLDSSVPRASNWPETLSWSHNYKPSRHRVLQIGFFDGPWYSFSSERVLNHASEWLLMPATINDFNLLMNDCLAGIKQRLENEAKLEENRQKVETERVAQERAAKQAEAEAERQRLETEAAREALRLVRETELAKTQALIEQLEREKIIIGIWQEVVVEKQKGAEARAEITNRYLSEIEANAAEFKASVVAKAAEIRRLQEINAAISDAIIAHNDEVERQLEAQAEREAEQRAKLEDLYIEAPELTPTPGESPAPTTEP